MAKDKAKTEAPKCPVTRAQFHKEAPSVITVRFFDGDKEVGVLSAMRRDFESGSVGYYAGDKIILPVGNTPCRVQCGINLTLVGSKELPK